MQALQCQTSFKAGLSLEVFKPQGWSSLFFSENKEGFFPVKDVFFLLLELTGVHPLKFFALLASCSQVSSSQIVSTSLIPVESRFSSLFSASSSFVTAEDSESLCNNSSPENLLRFFSVEDLGEKKERMSCCLSFSNWGRRKESQNH